MTKCSWLDSRVGSLLLSVVGVTACLSVGAHAAMVVEPGTNALAGQVDIESVHEAMEGNVGIAPFQIGDRWIFTGTDGFGVGTEGSPINLTWGFVGDGTSILGAAGEPTTGSSLVSFLDGLHDTASTGGADLTQRNWFSYFNDSFERLEALSGVTYTYEANDDGNQINGAVNSGTVGDPGVRPDVRIGGHSIDGQTGSNTLAYNYFPSGGDMVIDTDNSSLFGSTFSSALLLRNVVMHEAGHGLGLEHLESNNSNQLMEPFISTAFDGPQFDDLLGLQRNYGDTLEKNGGNDTIGSAFFAGSFAIGDSWDIGTDADDNVFIATSETDFVSIDDDSDADVFAFTVTDPSLYLDAVLTPYGPTYNEAPQTDPATTQTPLNAKALSDLVLEILDASGSTIATANATSAGGIESFANFTLSSGNYFVRVTGLDDNVQVYGLGLNFLALPEPTAACALLGFALIRRRSRA